MALNDENKIAVFRTLAEALGLARTLVLPFIVLSLLFALPNQALDASGVMETLNTYTSQVQEGGGALAAFPLSEMLIALVVGFVVLSGFGIFWYRYLLLGRQGALKFGFAALNGMVWRFTGYGLLVMGVGLVVFSIATAIACALCFLLKGLLGQDSTLLTAMLYGPIFVLAYVVPLSFAARTSLVFPAIAIGDAATLADAWAASKESGAALVWAILIAAVPFTVLSYAIHSAAGAAFGIDLLAGSTATAQAYWWLAIALSPVANLTLAFVLAVIAVAYRDLMSRESAVTAARESFAY